MDQLTFWAKIAEIVGGMAWPAVLVTVLIVYRQQIAEFVDRLQEFTLPGGYRVVLTNALREGREALSQFPAKYVGRARTLDDYMHFELAEETEPPSTIQQMLIAYVELERLIDELRRKYQITPRTPPSRVLAELANRNIVSAAAVQAFDKPREARNALVHLPERQVKPMEGIEFVAQTMVLRDYLSSLNK
jgi:hypothetical protein